MDARNDAPPPAYYSRPVNAISRMNRKPLRGSVFVWCLIGLIWCAVWAGYQYKYFIRDAVSKMKILDLVIAIMFTVVAAIEAYGLFSVYKASPKLLRTFSFLSIGASILAITASILAFIFNFIFKSDLLSACQTEATTGGVTLRTGWWWDDDSETTLTAVQAVKYCQDKWVRSVWGAVILVAAVAFIASLASLFAVAYSRQMASSNSSTDYNGALQDPSQGVPLSTYDSRLPDYVPAYPGPPPGGLVVDSKDGFVEHTAQDEAWNQALSESERREWDQHHANERAAQQNAGRRGLENEEEDEAWEEARRNGPTAHLTAGTNNPWGPGGSASRRQADEDEGRVV